MKTTRSQPSHTATSPTTTTFDSMSVSPGSSDKDDNPGSSPQASVMFGNVSTSNPIAVFQPFIDPSMVALHGSVLSSPVVKGIRDTMSLPFPKSRIRQSSKDEWPEHSQHLDEIREGHIEESKEITSATRRVILIDFDGVTKENNTAPVIVSMLKQLHQIGHPIHLVSSVKGWHREIIIDWLLERGITIGLERDNAIAAIWLVQTDGDSSGADIKTEDHRFAVVNTQRNAKLMVSYKVACC